MTRKFYESARFSFFTYEFFHSSKLMIWKWYMLHSSPSYTQSFIPWNLLVIRGANLPLNPFLIGVSQNLRQRGVGLGFHNSQCIFPLFTIFCLCYLLDNNIAATHQGIFNSPWTKLSNNEFWEQIWGQIFILLPQNEANCDLKQQENLGNWLFLFVSVR